MSEELDLFDQEDNGKYLIGTVNAVYFEASDSFYKVLQVLIKETNFDWDDQRITVTGSFANIQTDSLYRFEGNVVEHQRYGKQFQAESYQLELPSTKDGVIAYLSSDEFVGIGKKTAEKIVKKLGVDAIDVLNNDMDKLEELGLSEKQKDSIKKVLKENYGIDKIIIELNSLGFTSTMAGRIYNNYTNSTLEIIHEDPYRLSVDIDGISFTKADQIAQQFGFASDSPGRIRGAIFQSLYDLTYATGNTYVELKPLVTETLKLLESNRNEAIDPQLVADQLIKLAEEDKIKSDDNKVYSRTFFNAEWNIAENLYRLLKSGNSDLPNNDALLDKLLIKAEDQLEIDYDSEQKRAIKDAIKSPVFLLTGGPGTGKTTIINGIVAVYALLNDIDLDIGKYDKDNPFPILLAAPTGRAAKRMAESTGLPASTIHRMLGINAHDDKLPEDIQELEGALLIVDETSMVDTLIMDLLLNSIPSHMQVIFVGDRNQLPSVQPGQVFSDLLVSDTLPKKELTKIYRQGKGSSIINLAHSIKNGELPADFTKAQSDRAFIPCEAGQLTSAVEQVIKAALNKGNSKDDIQVLAPMYRGNAGINRLNTILQELLNPAKPRQKEVTFNEQIFRIGDRVLHLVNDPENNVFNGDIGKIVEINIPRTKKDKKGEQIIADFDGNEVTFDKKDWINLTLAYCMSIHKSQGSEFPIVVLAMLPQYQRMFARNLLYTGITRAKQKLVLLGNVSSFRQSAEIISLNRKTGLLKRIRMEFGVEEKPVEKTDNEEVAVNNNKEQDLIVEEQDEPFIYNDGILTMDIIVNNKVDAMIGMDDITPYDFME